MKFLSIFFWYLLPPVAWTALIFGLSFIPDLGAPSLGVWDFIFRKIGHVIEYLVLTFLLMRVALFENTASRTRFLGILLSCLVVLAVAYFDEMMIQRYIPGRVGALTDVAVDSIGILAVLAFFLIRKDPRRAFLHN